MRSAAGRPPPAVAPPPLSLSGSRSTSACSASAAACPGASFIASRPGRALLVPRPILRGCRTSSSRSPACTASCLKRSASRGRAGQHSTGVGGSYSCPPASGQHTLQTGPRPPHPLLTLSIQRVALQLGSPPGLLAAAARVLQPDFDAGAGASASQPCKLSSPRGCSRRGEGASGKVNAQMHGIWGTERGSTEPSVLTGGI